MNTYFTANWRRKQCGYIDRKPHFHYSIKSANKRNGATVSQDQPDEIERLNKALAGMTEVRARAGKAGKFSDADTDELLAHCRAAIDVFIGFETVRRMPEDVDHLRALLPTITDPNFAPERRRIEAIIRKHDQQAP